MIINSKFSSPNYSARVKNVEYIVVHFTEIAFDAALARLTDAASQVSSHYLIKEDGEIFQLVADEHAAWHAGESSWHSEVAINQNSIGIELDNLGNCAFSKEQINSCLALSQGLIEKHHILPKNFIGHSDIAPDRKIDPGIFFDWGFFAAHGLGVWHGLQLLDNQEIMYNFADQGKEIKTLQKKLKKLGYKIDITGRFDLQTNFVIRAFQAKFYPSKILQQGLEFYQDFSSLYSWDSESERILEKLL